MRRIDGLARDVARVKRFRHYLVAAKEEALLACELYNARRRPRNLEAFLVHMCIAWTNLLQALCERDSFDYYYRTANGRFVRVNGEKKSWELQRLVEHYFPKPNDPARRNIEFFIGLRNKIEHRLSEKQQKALLEVVSGKCQAYLRNFEDVLTREFTVAESLADQLHLPLFLSKLSDDALRSVKDIRSALPKGVISYIDAYDRSVGEHVSSDQAYEFRILLIPQIASRSAADMAIEFVNIDKLDDAKRLALDNAMVIVRDRHVPVANADRMKPGEVVARVKQSFTMFSMEAHRLAWHYFSVRPTKSKDKAANSKTDQRYCVYDVVHDDYTYYEAWVQKLLKELEGDPLQVIGKWKRAVTAHAAA